MDEKRDFYHSVEEIYSKDSRYKPESYEFLLQALNFTQKRIKREGHISGRELLDGIRDLAIEQFGPLARSVLKHWGVTSTEDFGNIVFNMIDKGMLSKTDTDSIDDFKNVYDFQTAFNNVLRDSLKNIESLD